MTWACNHIVLNCHRRPTDIRFDPLAIEFPLLVCWTGSGMLPPVISREEPVEATDITVAAGHTPTMPDASIGRNTTRPLRAQASDPLSVSVNVVKMGRTSQNLQRSLRADPRTGAFLNSLRNATGNGAHLICRELHRAGIENHFEVQGVELPGQMYYLSDMRPRHFLVADEFQAAFDQIASRIRGEQLNPKNVATVQVAVEANAEVVDLASDEDDGVPESSSRSSEPRPGRSHPYQTPASSSLAAPAEGCTGPVHQSINQRTTYGGIIIYNTTVEVTLPTCSEGSGLTASTGQMQGLNHRRARPHDDYSQTQSERCSLPSVPSTLPTQDTQESSQAAASPLPLDMGVINLQDTAAARGSRNQATEPLPSTETETETE